MKIINQYMLKEFASNYIAIPMNEDTVDYKHALHLNETGAFIWKKLEHETTYQDLLNALICEYEADSDETNIIKSDLDEFLNHMRSMKLLIE